VPAWHDNIELQGEQIRLVELVQKVDANVTPSVHTAHALQTRSLDAEQLADA
jgi:hypothetical protein